MLSHLSGVRDTLNMWSPALDAAVNLVRYWLQRQKCFSNKIRSEHLITKGVASGICDDVTLDFEEITTDIAQAYSMLDEVQNKDKEKRTEFLHLLAKKYAQDNKLDLETAVRELMDHEEPGHRLISM